MNRGTQTTLPARPSRRADNVLNNAEHVRRYRARQRAKGLCIRCPNPLAEGSTQSCVTHLAKEREKLRVSVGGMRPSYTVDPDKKKEIQERLAAFREHQARTRKEIADNGWIY